MISPPELYTAALRASIRRSVRRGLRGIWLRGEVPSGAAVLAPNHHSWWDGYVLRELAWQLEQPFSVLMTERQLATYPFLRLVGALGAHELRLALRSLQAGHWLVIFPEGRLEPPAEPRRYEPGAAWLARQSGAALYPVALRVVLRGHPQPEAYLRFGQAVSGSALPGALDSELRQLDKDLAASDPEEPLAGYLRVLGRGPAGADPPRPEARLLARLTRPLFRETQ